MRKIQTKLVTVTVFLILTLLLTCSLFLETKALNYEFVLGYDVIAPNDHTVPGSWWWGYRCQATKTATITMIKAYCRGLFGPTSIKAKVWNDTGGVPSNLLAESPGTPAEFAFSWVMFSINVNVTKDNYYWLGLFSLSDHVVRGDADTEDNDYYGSHGDYLYPNNPTSFIATGHSKNKLSIYGLTPTPGIPYTYEKGENLKAIGNNVNLFFTSGHGLGFQSLDLNYSVTMKVLNGTWNGTGANFVMHAFGGQLSFSNVNETFLEVIPSPGETGQIQVEGCAYSMFGNPGNMTWILNPKSGDNPVIRWSFTWPLWTPITFILGLTGLIFLIVGPTMVIVKIKEKKYDWFIYGFLILLIGVGLVIGWLWG